jgi:hypothetical protein
MTNDSLIATLEHLRDLYVQQQKAAVSLQTALKSATDALGKASKSLKEYSQQNRGIDETELTSTQTAFDSLRLKDDFIDPVLPDLRREIKALARLVGGLKEASVVLKSEPIDVVRLDHACTALEQTDYDDIRKVLPELKEELQLAQRSLGDVFGQSLREALGGQGIAIGGRPPKFEVGRFEIDANFAHRSATIRYGKDIVVPRVSISLDVVLKAYQSAARQVTERNENGERWIEQFHRAYDNARRKGDISGARVNIVDCYIEMVLLRQGRAFASEPSKRTIADYSRAQFIYDFYEFSHRQRRSDNGLYVSAYSATKSQTDSPTKSMWIVEGDNPYDGRYISDIEFKRE